MKEVQALSVSVTVLGNTKSITVKRSSLYPMTFSVRRSVLGPQSCHCSRSDTLTGVTVTDRACIRAERRNRNVNAAKVDGGRAPQGRQFRPFSHKTEKNMRNARHTKPLARE